MKCQKCVEQGLESKVYVGTTMTTLAYSAPFYDENGRYHYHNPNTTTTEYRCSNGHSFTETMTPVCWCQIEDDSEDNPNAKNNTL